MHLHRYPEIQIELKRLLVRDFNVCRVLVSIQLVSIHLGVTIPVFKGRSWFNFSQAKLDVLSMGWALPKSFWESSRAKNMQTYIVEVTPYQGPEVPSRVRLLHHILGSEKPSAPLSGAARRGSSGSSTLLKQDHRFGFGTSWHL